MTPTWGLRGATLELKGALGAPKEAPTEPKRGAETIGVAAGGFKGGKF